MTAFKTKFNPNKTPQSKPIPGRKMVLNRAGGYVFEIPKWEALTRFLTIGTMGGTFYAKEQELTAEAFAGILECVKEDTIKTLRFIEMVSDKGLALKNDYALFALAACSNATSEDGRRKAFALLPRIARTGTHLFQFCAYREQLGGGWGPLMREAVGNFYKQMDLDRLAYQVVKYQQRDGWSHRDLLRLCHVKPHGKAHLDKPLADIMEDRNRLFRWILDGMKGRDYAPAKGKFPETEPRPPVALETLPKIVQAFEVAKKIERVENLVPIIQSAGLTREMIPTQFLDKPEVQEALLENMPLHAMIRNLGNMTKSGLLTPTSEATKKVISALNNKDWLRKSRVHPFGVLVALNTYKTGKGRRGSGTWSPVTRIIDALDDAFYACLEAVPSSGKNILVAVDVSGSMHCPVHDLGMDALEVGAAMAFITLKTEPGARVLAFHTQAFGVEVSAKQRIDDAIRIFKSIPSGGTDCNIPMVAARKQGWKDLDALVIYTDNETWAGWEHPQQGLEAYRKWSGRTTKFVEVATTATKGSIADRNDPLTLGVSGFSADAAKVIGDFLGR